MAFSQNYAGIAGADLENAPQGRTPFTSPFGLPVTRMQTWHAGGTNPGGSTGGVPGAPVQRASGNPAVASAPVSLTRSPYGGQQASATPGNPPGQLPYGRGQNPAQLAGGLPQFGRPRPLSPAQESAAPRQPAVGSQNDKLIAYDRHGIFKVGYENSGRDSGFTDPPSQGPARPSLWLVQRSINYQAGSDNTLAQDDLSRDYTRVAVQNQGAASIGWVADPSVGPYTGYSGREGDLYAGEQGSGWAPIYGGVPGLWQPYGSYEGICNGPVQGIQSPAPEGSKGDGRRNVWSGPPHGLHSPTLPSYSQTIGRYMAVPQMTQPRMDRPSNSTIAGQSYSQTVIPQGQAGTVVAGTGPSRPQWNQRARGNGWRGRGGGG